MFLAVDTVFDQCSVAIVNEQLQTLSCHTQTGKREQTQQILPMIDSVLEEANIKLADLTALIFNRGPGPFSGIRINTAVVQALAVAHDLPCVGVSSLAAIAQAAHDKYGVQQVYAALDARMNQVYFAEYEFVSLVNLNNLDGSESDGAVSGLAGIMTLVDGTQEQLVDYEQSTQNNSAIAGNGAALLTAQDEQKIYSDIHPDALSLAKLGVIHYQRFGGVSADQALPVYLRNDAWKTLKEQGKA
ncbi:tRNA (adenosine(37)-N6)-threonylcarbamoyltransferase complex dimerization subunit type 1 TsaB [Psychrobacter sp. FDAARGOS_221]|uniref:tRNA (adenosine(37)-N6)-threonylcarbamoyltransferase complex dimerization subunit type 1 TsaB n=1 Tax=Psychrobacter sp. FDAARGOS_221 TaxID=1975705 RepID=UPI000BB58B0E|nr:tRNA (adenosine(37)-N6)-threonylcarbamoyltransferase complex dimerization subunit type 1 TsaB [Psychrobacter sp. FDAARGOS_221]PNK60224.1 tRNA (adenosine(37)-N6)-threonylcarbamoyltransferase complex dimerization subunit type 1 TsaB [Psychrobacter sp. FDAARGOS_221]